jgi:hypothetical protein
MSHLGKAWQVEYLDALMLMVDSVWGNPYIFFSMTSVVFAGYPCWMTT